MKMTMRMMMAPLPVSPSCSPDQRTVYEAARYFLFSKHYFYIRQTNRQTDRQRGGNIPGQGRMISNKLASLVDAIAEV